MSDASTARAAAQQLIDNDIFGHIYARDVSHTTEILCSRCGQLISRQEMCGRATDLLRAAVSHTCPGIHGMLAVDIGQKEGES